MKDVELSKEGGIFPISLIDNGSQFQIEALFSLRSRIDISLIALIDLFELCDVDFKGFLVSEIRQLIGSNQSDDSPIINSEDG